MTLNCGRRNGAHIADTPRDRASFPSALRTNMLMPAHHQSRRSGSLGTRYLILAKRTASKGDGNAMPDKTASADELKETLTKVHDVIPADSTVIDNDIFNQHAVALHIRVCVRDNIPHAHNATAFHCHQPCAPPVSPDQPTFFTSNRGFLSPDSTTALDDVGGSISISADMVELRRWGEVRWLIPRQLRMREVVSRGRGEVVEASRRRSP